MSTNMLRPRRSWYNAKFGTPIYSITMKTTNCYNNMCPVFELGINVDKKVFRYIGSSNIPKNRLGFHHGKISTFHIELLVEYIESLGFFKLANEYHSGEMDRPTTEFTLTLKNGLQKTIVYDSNAGPAQLYALRLMIDHIINSAQWIQ